MEVSLVNYESAYELLLRSWRFATLQHTLIRSDLPSGCVYIVSHSMVAGLLGSAVYRFLSFNITVKVYITKYASRLSSPCSNVTEPPILPISLSEYSPCLPSKVKLYFCWLWNLMFLPAREFTANDSAEAPERHKRLYLPRIKTCT